jgi:GNAT superfamily N-acetyltransferase
VSAPTILDRWFSRIGSAEPIDLAEEGQAVVPELLAAYTPPGFELHVLDGSVLWVVEGGVVADLSAELVPESEDAALTGVIQRRIDTTQGRAIHLKFELPEFAQGQGRGRRVLRASADLYVALGISQIELTAVDKGKYVWAAAGFSFANDQSRAEVIDGIEFAAELLGLTLIDLDRDRIEPWEIAFMPPAEGLTVRDALEALDPEGLELAQGAVDNLDAPLDRPGKVLLLADEVPGWQGYLDLRPSDDNPGLDTFYAYTD